MSAEEAQPRSLAAKTVTLAVAESKAPFDWLGPPHSRCGLWCANVIARRWFGVLFPCLILLNTLLMCASLLTAYCSLLTAYCSLLTAYCALLTKSRLTRPLLLLTAC